MCFIHDNNGLQALDTAHQFNFAVQLALGVTTIKLGFAAQLFQKALVEMPGCEFGVRQVHDHEHGRVQSGLEQADSGGFASTAVAGDDGKKLPFGGILQPAQCFFQHHRLVQLVCGYVPGKGCFSQAVEGLKHGCCPPCSRPERKWPAPAALYAACFSW